MKKIFILLAASMLCFACGKKADTYRQSLEQFITSSSTVDKSQYEQMLTSMVEDLFQDQKEQGAAMINDYVSTQLTSDLADLYEPAFRKHVSEQDLAELAELKTIYSEPRLVEIQKRIDKIDLDMQQTEEYEAFAQQFKAALSAAMREKELPADIALPADISTEYKETFMQFYNNSKIDEIMTNSAEDKMRREGVLEPEKKKEVIRQYITRNLPVVMMSIYYKYLTLEDLQIITELSTKPCYQHAMSALAEMQSEPNLSINLLSKFADWADTHYPQMAEDIHHLLEIIKILQNPAKLGEERVLIGDLYYNLYDNGTAEVTYKDFLDSDNYEYLKGEVTIPSSVQVKSKTYVVTSIGEDAFYSCERLRSVTIPNSVTSIGNVAFEDCESLTSITIPESVTSIGRSAFDGCERLKSITIPNGVTSIEDHAFLGCKSLTSVTIPNSVTSIGEGAFYNCESLTSVTIPNSVTSIGDYAFKDCESLTSITIPASVTSIGRRAFYDCNSLTSITIPESVTSIGEDAFYNIRITEPIYTANVFAYLPRSYSGHYSIPEGIEQIAGGAFCDCRSLTSVTIPESVTSIGRRAFRNCSGLTTVTIPTSVTSIGDEAFSNSRITEPIYIANVFAYLPESYSGHYSIPEGISTIAGEAFRNCKSLTSVTIPNSVTSIGDRAFSRCVGLTSITIPNSVTSIGDQAFYDCNSLTSITIPNSVTSIGDYAFDGCESLRSITIPNSVTRIEGDVFSNCKSLTSVTIPNSVTDIGSRAFYNCKSLTSVTIPNSVTNIQSSVFRGCESLTSVTIPKHAHVADDAFDDCSPNLQIIYEE